jgi:peptidoglycan/xylan/chitin deacetylase (PgdA/CDA1 family)
MGETFFMNINFSFPVKACISIDLEELDDSIIWHKTQEEVDIGKAVARITSLLEKFSIKATFFVLGTFFEKHRKIVKSLKRNGHEIGSHFYSHTNLYELSEKQIEEGIKRSKKLLGKVKGFRAPMYTMDMRTIRILEKHDFKYDSSVFPSVIYPHPSVKKIEKRHRVRVERRSEPYAVGGIIEIPLTVFPSYLGIPVTGTSIRMYGRLLAKMVRFFRGNVFVINVHPFEFLENHPRYEGTPFWFQRNSGEKLEKGLEGLVKSLIKKGVDFRKMEGLI